MMMECIPELRVTDPVTSFIPWKLLLFTTSVPSMISALPSSLRVVNE